MDMQVPRTTANGMFGIASRQLAGSRAKLCALFVLALIAVLVGTEAALAASVAAGFTVALYA